MEKELQLASIDRITKTWEESTIEEKLEKVRKELMAMRYNTTAINNLHQDVEELMKHEHGSDGLPVVKIKKNYGSGSLGQVSRLDNLA